MEHRRCKTKNYLREEKKTLCEKKLYQKNHKQAILRKSICFSRNRMFKFDFPFELDFAQPRIDRCLIQYHWTLCNFYLHNIFTKKVDTVTKRHFKRDLISQACIKWYVKSIFVHIWLNEWCKSYLPTAHNWRWLKWGISVNDRKCNTHELMQINGRHCDDRSRFHYKSSIISF